MHEHAHSLTPTHTHTRSTTLTHSHTHPYIHKHTLTLTHSHMHSFTPNSSEFVLVCPFWTLPPVLSVLHPYRWGTNNEHHSTGKLLLLKPSTQQDVHQIFFDDNVFYSAEADTNIVDVRNMGTLWLVTFILLHTWTHTHTRHTHTHTRKRKPTNKSNPDATPSKQFWITAFRWWRPFYSHVCV